MSQQIINIGAAPNDGSGDQLRLSFNKCNDNFTELYAKAVTEGLWNYNKTSTDTSTSPVSGRFRTNSGNYRDATQIAIHAITIQGIDRTSTLRALLVGDSIQCQDSTNSAAWCRYSLQSLPVDHGTWFQLNVTFQTDGGVTSGDNQEIVFVFTAGSGSGTAAPVGAEYITSSADATLTAERVLTNTATITWDFTTPGQAKASAAGGGNVSNSGTPTLGQYAKWVTATTIQGVAPATVLSDIGAQPAGSYQPLDGDLTSLAAAAATNTIYYRSAANTWAAATIGSGLTFSGGTLAAVSATGITTINVQKFTASGTYTPTAGMKYCIIECVGGGAGGGTLIGTANMIYIAGGGGSGGYSRKYATAADIGASKTVTVGAGGAGSTTSGNGGAAGGDTSVGSLCIAKGAPAVAGWAVPGAAGVAGTGDITAAGGCGLGGMYITNTITVYISTGGGGNSVFGGGGSSNGNPGVSVMVNGNPAANYGGGGGGSASNNFAATPTGGAGSAGIVIITEFI